MVSFICPGCINLLLYLDYKPFCSMQVENLAVCRVMQNVILIRKSLQKDMSHDSPNINPFCTSLVLWMLLQYCLSWKHVFAFKENLPVIPLDYGLAHIMKCSCSESAYLCNLVLCKPITDLEKGGGWKGPLEVILSKLR